MWTSLNEFTFHDKNYGHIFISRYDQYSQNGNKALKWTVCLLIVQCNRTDVLMTLGIQDFTAYCKHFIFAD
jgi:hypothetical protein